MEQKDIDKLIDGKETFIWKHEPNTEQIVSELFPAFFIKLICIFLSCSVLSSFFNPFLMLFCMVMLYAYSFFKYFQAINKMYYGYVFVLTDKTFYVFKGGHVFIKYALSDITDITISDYKLCFSTPDKKYAIPHIRNLKIKYSQLKKACASPGKKSSSSRKENNSNIIRIKNEVNSIDENLPVFSTVTGYHPSGGELFENSSDINSLPDSEDIKDVTFIEEEW